MVNAVKTARGQAPNGSFYINEYKQVIVPVVGSTDYYLAGATTGRCGLSSRERPLAARRLTGRKPTEPWG